jgi:glutamine synthetase
MEDVPFADIEDIGFTIGTELEFWVKTPSENETIQHLSISQRLQEQYWQRMRGNVRTAMEETIEELDARGMHVEMGHKEVGGIKPKVDDSGKTTDVCEQLELDWLFSSNPLRIMNWKQELLSVKCSASTALTFPSRQSRSSG